MNIVYATTHGWNVGDEFIRMGAKSLLSEIFPFHNRLIYDKAPHVRRYEGKVYEQPEFHGNSVDYPKHKDYPFDLMVIAGTPENNSGRMLEFFKRSRGHGKGLRKSDHMEF